MRSTECVISCENCVIAFKTGTVPEDWKNVVIVHYIKKRVRKMFNNYKGYKYK